MKKTLLIVLASVWCAAICAQPSNPLDAAIKQIDHQSRELTQQVIANQQEGTARQKIARLELELTTCTAEHAQELAAIQKDIARIQHEANAQHKADQALIAQLRAEIADLKRTQESKKPVAPQEPSLDLDEEVLLDIPEQA